MSCNGKGCNINLKSFGTYDLSRIQINGKDRTQLNWNELSIPEIFTIPDEKPDIEHLDQIYVDAKIEYAKLIETPFAYKTYERLATAFEVTSALNAINSAVVDIAPIIAAVTAILNIPLLPAIPQVTALQEALTNVTTASTNLTTAITTATTALAAPCIAASVVISLINAVLEAVNALVAALNALIAAANALAQVTAAIPVVGPAVAAAVTALLAAITTVVNTLLTAVQSLLNTIILIGNTSYLVIIPNEEGTCLSGRKLIIEGTLTQKVVYTGLVSEQSVHSAHNQIPFTAYIIPYAKFDGLSYEENVQVIADPNGDPCATITVSGFSYDPTKPVMVDLCEEFCINAFIEDIFAYAVDTRNVFKNITLFLYAKPGAVC